VIVNKEYTRKMKVYRSFLQLVVCLLLIEPIEDNINKDIEKGIALHDQGKFVEAIKVYDEVITNFPFSAWAYYEKSYSLLLKGHFKSENLREELYEKARKCEPFFLHAYQGTNKMLSIINYPY